MPAITAICDFIYTIAKGRKESADFQYVTPIVIIVSMVGQALFTVLHNVVTGIQIFIGDVCSGVTLGSYTRSPFLWPNASLLVGPGHLWLTQTENLHPHCQRPGVVHHLLASLYVVISRTPTHSFPPPPLTHTHTHTYIAWSERQVSFQHLLSPVHGLPTSADSQCRS